MSTSKYPLDFDEIKKGDVITEDVIELAMECKVGTKQFEFKMMALGAMIWHKTGFIVKAQNYTQLRVLTDEEAVNYSAKTFQTGQRKMLRGYTYSQSVDAQQISDAAKKRLESNIINQGRILQAMKRERRLIKNGSKPQELTE